MFVDEDVDITRFIALTGYSSHWVVLLHGLCTCDRDLPQVELRDHFAMAATVSLDISLVSTLTHVSKYSIVNVSMAGACCNSIVMLLGSSVMNDCLKTVHSESCHSSKLLYFVGTL